MRTLLDRPELADLVIAEVEHIVPIGELDPNEIHTPGCYVDYLVQAHTTLEDLGSTNGTTVNGRRVIGAAVVREGDQVLIAGIGLEVAGIYDADTFDLSVALLSSAVLFGYMLTFAFLSYAQAKRVVHGMQQIRRQKRKR